MTSIGDPLVTCRVRLSASFRKKSVSELWRPLLRFGLPWQIGGFLTRKLFDLRPPKIHSGPYYFHSSTDLLELARRSMSSECQKGQEHFSSPVSRKSPKESSLT